MGLNMCNDRILLKWEQKEKEKKKEGGGNEGERKNKTSQSWLRATRIN